MPKLKYIAISSDQTNEYRNGNRDANHQFPELLISDGSGLPCRHCLTDISENESCFLLGYRPFSIPDAYAEVGPIFIHKDDCWSFEQGSIPEIISKREQVLVRGYDENNRIIDGTGQMVNTEHIEQKCVQVLSHDKVKYLHVRSASNNCYFCRVELED